MKYYFYWTFSIPTIILCQFHTRCISLVERLHIQFFWRQFQTKYPKDSNCISLENLIRYSRQIDCISIFPTPPSLTFPQDPIFKAFFSLYLHMYHHESKYPQTHSVGRVLRSGFGELVDYSNISHRISLFVSL